MGTRRMHFLTIHFIHCSILMMILWAKFDLETRTPQLDAVNAFVHAEIDEPVYMRLSGYPELAKALELNQALWSLPVLWQIKSTNAMRFLGFDELPQEPCVMKGGIICFYSVDDIVFAFRQKDRGKVQEMVENLKRTLTIKVGELNGSLECTWLEIAPKILFGSPIVHQRTLEDIK